MSFGIIFAPNTRIHRAAEGFVARQKTFQVFGLLSSTIAALCRIKHQIVEFRLRCSPRLIAAALSARRTGNHQLVFVINPGAPAKAAKPEWLPAGTPLIVE